MKKRVELLNSLLKKVIAEVISKKIRNPNVSVFVVVKRVDVSKDLHNGKVYISTIGTSIEKEKTLKALRSAAGFISMQASKKVSMHYFPHLTFYLEDTLEDEIRINFLLEKINDEQNNRKA
jgi:ribosome-binding factor A